MPVRVGRTAEVLNEIHLPGVELALWRRSLAAGLTPWLNSLPFRLWPQGAILADRASLGAAITGLVGRAGLSGPGVHLLIEDIKELAIRFLALSDVPLVEVRLEAIDDNACAGFHRDNVTLRMITTYCGPGTQWVAPEHSKIALKYQQAYRGPVETFPTEAVGVFRGSRAPGVTGLTHRSPPIEGLQQTRLLLCLNMPTTTSPAPWQDADS